MTRTELLLLAAAFAVSIAWFAEIPRNPPGFFIDEASIAFNALTISRQGVDEYGQSFPLYFRAFGEYKNPVYIYALATLYRITGPSVFVARFLSAIFGFAAALLLGLLAVRITRRRVFGLIVFIVAGLTPWLFEVSRLVFEVALFPALLALFLVLLQHASKRERWQWPIVVALGGLLGLIAYSYSAGRLLAPLFALGLFVFLTRRRWRGVLLTWIVFGLTLLPLAVFSMRNPGALFKRFQEVTYIKAGESRTEIVFGFVKNYAGNFRPYSWLIAGDPESRHHLPGMGSLLVGMVILAALGALLVLLQHRREAWWRFILYGLAVSAIPAALTQDHFHTLRLIAMPVFLLVLVIPALEYLDPDSPASTEEARFGKRLSPRTRRLLLVTVVLVTIVQGTIFQWQFHTAPPRINAFESFYPDVLNAALAKPQRPIYLLDKTPAAYMYALWYATLRGLDLNNFRRVGQEAPTPPAGSVVISHELPCSNCETIFERGEFRVYVQK